LYLEDQKSHKERRKEGSKSLTQELVKYSRIFMPNTSETDEYVNAIPGLVYIRDFITSEEENEISKNLDSENWATDLKRRVLVWILNRIYPE
jgi:hypothetical protein